jgi:hypothetical protein
VATSPLRPSGAGGPSPLRDVPPWSSTDIAQLRTAAARTLLCEWRHLLAPGNRIVARAFRRGALPRARLGEALNAILLVWYHPSQPTGQHLDDSREHCADNRARPRMGGNSHWCDGPRARLRSMHLRPSCSVRNGFDRTELLHAHTLEQSTTAPDRACADRAPPPPAHRSRSHRVDAAGRHTFSRLVGDRLCRGRRGTAPFVDVEHPTPCRGREMAWPYRRCRDRRSRSPPAIAKPTSSDMGPLPPCWRLNTENYPLASSIRARAQTAAEAVPGGLSPLRRWSNRSRDLAAQPRRERSRKIESASRHVKPTGWFISRMVARVSRRRGSDRSRLGSLQPGCRRARGMVGKTVVRSLEGRATIVTPTSTAPLVPDRSRVGLDAFLGGPST